MTLLSLEETFKRLGLPRHSHQVYQLLERKDGLSASELTRETQLHRPAVYRALTVLLERSLIQKNGSAARPLYTAAPRAYIQALFSGTLTDIYIPKMGSGLIEQLYGVSGIRKVFEDVIHRSKRGDTFYRFTSEKDLDEVNGYLLPGYRARRDTKKLERLVISNSVSGKRKQPRLERFIKYLSSDTEPFTHNAIQLIYADRIAFIDLNTKESIIITNSTLASFQKSIFRALYKKL